MGILGYSNGDVDGMGLRDEQMANDFDARLVDITRMAQAATAN
jgi:hypothetical protein